MMLHYFRLEVFRFKPENSEVNTINEFSGLNIFGFMNCFCE
jgi:hypothetical protein